MKKSLSIIILAVPFIFSACSTTKPPEVKKVLTSFELGKKALEARDAPAAIDAFSSCLVDFPDDPDCHWELGWSYFLNFQYGNARSEWEIVARLQPKRDGLDKVMEKVTAHLDAQIKGWMLRSKTIPSFNPQKKRNPDAILIRAAGDTMLGTNYPSNQLPPLDSSPLREVEPFLADSDVNFVNYEGTLCDQKSDSKCDFQKGTCFAFRGPTKLADWLRHAKINLVSLANNHTMDFGGVCQEETEKTMESRRINWSGRKDTVARFEKKGVKFSLIAFHSADHTNSTRAFTREKELIKAETDNGRRVIVSFHGGAEGYLAVKTPEGKEMYSGEDRGDVRTFAHTAIDAGADLVLGHGPHVMRGMEFYKKKLIAYSLGNFATYAAFSLWGPTAFGGILEVELSKTGDFLSGKIIPLVQQGEGVPEFDRRAMALDLVRLLSRQDFGDAGVEVAHDGTLGTQLESRRFLASQKALPAPRKQNRPKP